MHLRAFAVCAILVAGVAISAYAVPPKPVPTPGWESISQRPDSDDPDRFDAYARDGYLYVTLSRPTTVRLYSILGQLISQQTLQPGTTRVRITARGVYILKAGSVTRRITI